ncbi:MAG: hypothetical protein GKR94_10690 [Gammaproteobacteria bacterium]|nr:hypothetical protein [Gammaproteobacteria bacterium]
MREWLAQQPDTQQVAQFVPGPGLQKLALQFDIARLRTALDEVLRLTDFRGEQRTQGFGAISLTRRPGATTQTANDLSGRYWLRPDERYMEEPREDLVDESAFSEFIPAYAGTYFATVHEELTQRFPVGRMRVLEKGLYNCNSWHRDPEPRIHIPIVSNPGSLFVVNNHCTHLPADGSVYFTDTRGYHMAMNGGLTKRISIVAALPLHSQD